eukprot:1158877-Amphidinium_carterae.1
MLQYSRVPLAPHQTHQADFRALKRNSCLPLLMAKYQTRRRPEPALQRDDVIPTPLDNKSQQHFSQLQQQRPHLQQLQAQISPWRPTGMPIPSESQVVRPPPGLEDQRVTHRLRTKTSFTGPESVLKRSRVESQGVKRGSDTVPEDLQIQSGAASQERFNAMESVPEEATHDEMVSAFMSDLVDHKLLSIHGLVVNEDSKEKEMQKITSEVILQDFYVDADG